MLGKISDHFGVWELATHDGTPIPEKYLPKYRDTLEFAERLRGFMNFCIYDRTGKWEDRGIECVSGYRHLQYNLRIGSSKTSMHTDPYKVSDPFNRAPCAMDLCPVYEKGAGKYNLFTYDEFYWMAELVDKSFPNRDYRLGRYNKSRFVHVDCGYGHGSTRWVGN